MRGASHSVSQIIPLDPSLSILRLQSFCGRCTGRARPCQIVFSSHPRPSRPQTRRLGECRCIPALLQCRHRKTVVLAFSVIIGTDESFTLEKFISTVTAPTPKAKTSVTLVTVTETPACFNVRPIFSGVLLAELLESLLILDQHCTITNMSSIPMPEQTNEANILPVL